MTVNTQELWDLLNDFGNAAQGRDWETDAQAAAQNYANKATNLWRGIIALLAENEALRAELQARQWMPIETAPKHTEVLVWRDDSGSFIAKLTSPDAVMDEAELEAAGPFPDDFEEWFSDAYGWQEGNERPTHWMPLPPDPPQGDGA